MKFIRIIILILLLSTIFSYAAQRLQAIHNSADPVLDTIDVYISVFGSQVDKIEDVPFRAATPFIDVPFPNLTIDVGIAPANSISIDDTLKNFSITVPSGVTYIGLFQGVLDTSKFAPNPDKLDISVDAIVNENGRETSNNPGEVDLFFIHGVTDAPTIDINIQGGMNLVDNTAYGGYTTYFSLMPTTYTIDITDESGNTVLYSYALDLTNYADSALTLFASGFVDPNSNENGELFGLFAATPGGNIIEFSTITDIGEGTENVFSSYQLNQNYPNPFNPTTMISYQLAMDSEVELTIYNMLGQEIRNLVKTHQPVGTYQIQWNGKDNADRDVASGLYLYQLKTPEYTQSRKMLLLR